MTQIKVDTLTDAAGTGAPDFVDGVTYEGGALSSLNTFEYYSTGTEPSTPNDGAIWWDTGNDKVFMFIDDEWKEVELGASAGGASWDVDLSNVSYDNVSFSVSSQEANPYGVRFNNDGTKMYIIGATGDDVNQYSLSTAFDVSSASFDSVTFSVAGQDSGPTDVAFNSDGTKMYVVGYGSDAVRQYSLSTAFDISTASYDSVSLSVAGQDSFPTGIAFSADGTKMFVSGSSSDSVHQYGLTTGFDVSTAYYDSVSFSTASQGNDPHSVSFNTDGSKMYVLSQSTDIVHQYTLSTLFDLSTASYDSVSFSAGSQAPFPTGSCFSADGTKMYVVDLAVPSVYQYSTGL